MKTKFIKIIYGINKISFVITALLFITIIYGFFAEMYLGVIQVLSSLLLLIYWNDYSKKEKERLLLYYKLVIGYFLLWLINWDFLPSELAILVE